MASKTLVTQGELKNTVNGLDAIANNLNDHVNDSMSKAHGWTGIQHRYMDSGGSYHSGPAGPDTLQRVVRIAIGDKLYFAPAQLSGGIDGTADVVITPTTGVLSPQQADPSEDLTVGSPSEVSLVTQFADALNIVAESANIGLLAHIGSAPELVHGGLNVQTDYERDAPSGHVVGRRSVTVLLNGVPWRILCDTSPYGPTQPGRFIGSACPQIITFGRPDKPGHGGVVSVLPTCGIYEHMDKDNGNTAYVIGLTVTGTPPLSYQWQYTVNPNDPNSWNNIVLSHLNPGNAGFAFEALPTGFYPGDEWLSGPASGVLTDYPPVSSPVRLLFQNSGSKRNAANPAFVIRLKLDNTAVQDGAVTYSSPWWVQLDDTRDKFE